MESKKLNAIANNLFSISERIARAAERSNRTPDSIELVAVTKGRSVSEMQAVLAAGVTNIGENRVQEARQKYAAISSVITNHADKPCRWHLVGHLQRNKVK